MKTRLILGSLLAIAAVGALAACGGGDGSGGESAIRIQKGLAVAAVGDSLNTGSDSQSSGAAPATDQFGVPIPGGGGTTTTDVSIGRSIAGYGGGFAPQQLQQVGANGITVQGYASASADADSAVVEFYFGTTPSGVEPVPYPGGIKPGYPQGDVQTSPAAEVEPITEADLQPVIDALVNAGVSRDDIEFIGQPYFDKFFSSATLRATVKNLDSLDAVIKAAEDASAGLDGITLQSTNASYTVSDCSALEIAAMKAAVEDANDRAASFAQALGVGLGSITGASNFSYFGGTPCDSGYFKGPYPLGGPLYVAGQSREVQIFANIAVTYAIQ